MPSAESSRCCIEASKNVAVHCSAAYGCLEASESRSNGCGSSSIAVWKVSKPTSVRILEDSGVDILVWDVCDYHGRCLELQEWSSLEWGSRQFGCGYDGIG